MIPPRSHQLRKKYKARFSLSSISSTTSSTIRTSFFTQKPQLFSPLPTLTKTTQNEVPPHLPRLLPGSCLSPAASRAPIRAPIRSSIRTSIIPRPSTDLDHAPQPTFPNWTSTCANSERTSLPGTTTCSEPTSYSATEAEWAAEPAARPKSAGSRTAAGC